MKILVVDDEKNIRDTIQKYLKLENLSSDIAENGLSAKRKIEEDSYSLIVLDLKMPGMSGLSFLEHLRNNSIQIPVIMISAFGEIQDAVTAMKIGARDYLVKPFEPEELVLRIKNILEEERIKNKIKSTPAMEYDHFVGSSKKITVIKKLMQKIAPTPSNILITGESGTGKEVIARNIHTLSNFSNGPFIGINIAGLPDSLIESELFGYEKGAFTGAVSRKLGLFELANTGTLFLDEIGDMPINMQVKLLRVIQERKLTRVGGENIIPFNVRIISATNQNLESLINDGLFREDLYYRLNVIRIEIPPLRERPDDINDLVSFFISRLNKSMGKDIKDISSDALKKLQQYSFKGNIRELENLIERAYIFSDTNTIENKDIDILENSMSVPFEGETLKSIEKKYISLALKKWENNKTKTAFELGITRKTLLNKIKEYSIVF